MSADDTPYGMNPYYDAWREAVVAGDTFLGLHDWIVKRREREQREREAEE